VKERANVVLHAGSPAARCIHAIAVCPTAATTATASGDASEATSTATATTTATATGRTGDTVQTSKTGTAAGATAADATAIGTVELQPLGEERRIRKHAGCQVFKRQVAGIWHPKGVPQSVQLGPNQASFTPIVFVAAAAARSGSGEHGEVHFPIQNLFLPHPEKASTTRKKQNRVELLSRESTAVTRQDIRSTHEGLK
jgi:hypothetical protein